MFRGGRVDSRGTGIASGLSYNNGGRVGLKRGGNPFNINLGGGSTKTGQAVMDAATSKWGRAKNLVKNPNFSERGLYEAAKKYGPKAWNWGKSGITGILSRFPGLAQLGAYYGLATPTPVDEKYGITRMDNLFPFMDSEFEGSAMQKKIKRNLEESKNPNNPWRYDFWTHGSAKDHPDYDPEKRSWWPWAEGAAATGEEEIVEEKIDPELAAALAKIEERDALIKLMEEQARVKKNKKLTKEEKIAKIKENEEMFREVYGSGRGEDATAMLLNFAGKALKPEATVKSAFGEFFEEEGKRPSERKKYKDAAAQAAIQSFLAGETSYQKFKDELDLYKDKIDIQTAGAKAVEKNKSFATIRGESREQSNTRKNRDSAQKWLDNNDINKFVNETNSKKVPTEELFVEENIGEYFIDQQTGEFFLITVLENGEIGKVRKG